jgi:hypothetical protein
MREGGSKVVRQYLGHWLPMIVVGVTLGGCAREAPEAGAVSPAPTHPNLSGVWMAFASIAPDGARTPKYSEQGRATMDAFYAQYTQVPELGAFCVGAGMPGVMLSTVAYPIEIVQTDDRLVMLAELEMQVRRIFLDGRGHPDDFLPTGVGHSIARWEGDALVVDTTLLEEWAGRPWPRGEHTQIEERLSLTKRAAVDVESNGFVASVEPPINDDVLVVDLTLTDPTLYDGPQRRVAYYQRMDDTATLEYGCSGELWRQELEKYRVSQ